MTRVLRSRRARVGLVLALVVAAVAGTLWWRYPANRLRRALAAIETPAGMSVERQDVYDEGWICFDSCSSANRYYVTDLPPDDAAPLLLQALRDAGFTATDLDWCLSACTLGGPSDGSKGKVVWQTDIDRGRVDGWASIGVREDGRYGAEVVLIART